MESSKLLSPHCLAHAGDQRWCSEGRGLDLQKDLKKHRQSQRDDTPAPALQEDGLGPREGTGTTKVRQRIPRSRGLWGGWHCVPQRDTLRSQPPVSQDVTFLETESLQM